MHIRFRRLILSLALVLPLASCHKDASSPYRSSPDAALVGAWVARVQFHSGALADMHDLKFMYVYNAGGTLTESSNYDGAPPVPPAYGVWKALGGNRFRTRYAFFINRAPQSFADIAHGGGWLPAGHGVLTETLTLSADGKTYTSKMDYAAFDANGKPMAGGGRASAKGIRMDL